MATMRKAAPKAAYTQQADTAHAAAFGAIDFLAVAGKPNFACQKLVLIGVAAGNVVVTPEKGVDLTINLAIGQRESLETPIKAIVSATATGNFIAYWWDTHGSLNWNNE